MKNATKMMNAVLVLKPISEEYSAVSNLANIKTKPRWYDLHHKTVSPKEHNSQPTRIQIYVTDAR